MNTVVIEDQVMLRNLFVRLCRTLLPCGEIGEAPDLATGRQLCRTLRPDIVLLDLDLPDGDGLDLVADLRSCSPDCRIVIVTSHCDEFAISRSLEANVAAFVDKCAQPIEAVEEALASVLAGRTFFSPVVGQAKARLRNDPMAFTKLLSPREQYVLRLLGEGLANDQVAQRIGVSAQTVHTYRRNIMAKLGIHSTPELIRYAVEKGFSRLRPAAIA